MPRCQIGSRLAQAVGIDRAAVEFDIEMACHAAERLVVVASYPHGVLHRGERKRVVRCGGCCHGLRIDPGSLRAFGKDAPAVGDRKAIFQYVLLLVVLAAMCTIRVPMGAGR